MRTALVAVPSMLALVASTSPASDAFDGIRLEPSEVGRKDYNPFVTRMLTLYSQASRTNMVTRGLDDIARLTYVRTGLDEKARACNYQRPLSTGDRDWQCGRRKTAFLQQVEALFAQNGAKIDRLPSNNGSTWSWEHRTYETNYDGSQDEEDRSNDAVLDDFFKPFGGEEMVGLASSTVH